VYLHSQADNRTSHWSFLNFCKIPWNSLAISKFHQKGQVLRPAENCGP